MIIIDCGFDFHALENECSNTDGDVDTCRADLDSGSLEALEIDASADLDQNLDGF